MEEGAFAVVRGRQIVTVQGAALRGLAGTAVRVVVDLGAGDGRWIYRLALSRPDWLALAVDANASAMREASHRAGRKPSRGGAANAWFIRASAEALPPAMWGLADEIHVHLPWGSLLRGVLSPEPGILEGIAHLAKPGAALCIRVNRSILDGPSLMKRLGLRPVGHGSDEGAFAAAYAGAGIHLVRVALERQSTVTSWGRRLGAGRAPLVLALDGTVRPAHSGGLTEGWDARHEEPFSAAVRFGGAAKLPSNLHEV